MPPLPSRPGAWIVALAAARVALHLATHRGYGIFRDELYYLACGAHLAWGYVDHPPLIGLVARGVRSLLGESLLAIRLLPALAGGATVLLTGALCRALGGGAFASALACACVALSPVLLSLGHFLSMNAFEPLFWTGAALLLVRRAQGGDARLWLAFGAVAGVGLLNKHSMLLFGFGAAVAVLATPLRRDLRGPYPWLGLGVALALFAPNLLWQHANGWPTLEFMENARRFKNTPLAPLDFLKEQVLQQGPLAAPVWIVGLASALFTERGRPARALGIVYTTMLGVLLVTEAKAYYLAPAYPMLFAAGGVAVEAWSRRRRVVVAALAVVGGALGMPMSIPLLPRDAFIRYAEALGLLPQSAGERHEVGRLPQFYADMHGWPELAREVGRVYAALPEGERRACGIYAQNYGEAGAIDWFGPAHGLPAAISGHNSYWTWGPRDVSGECLVVIGGVREELLQWFKEVEVAGRFGDEWTMPYERGAIHVCRRMRTPLGEAWPRIKHFQ